MKKNETKELYSVGQICEKTGITRKTLFYYDRNGLLTPTERSGPQQFKFYDEEKLARLKLIITYREAGLSIAEIREILDDQKSDRLKVLKGALNRLLQERDETDQEIKKKEKIKIFLYKMKLLPSWKISGWVFLCVSTCVSKLFDNSSMGVRWAYNCVQRNLRSEDFMKKRLLIAVISALCVCNLAACGGKTTETAESKPAETQEESNSSQEKDEDSKDTPTEFPMIPWISSQRRMHLSLRQSVLHLRLMMTALFLLI